MCNVYALRITHYQFSIPPHAAHSSPMHLGGEIGGDKASSIIILSVALPWRQTSAGGRKPVGVMGYFRSQ